MRLSLFCLLLVSFLAIIHFQQIDGHLPPIFKGKGLGKGGHGKEAGGTALAAVISSRKLGLGLKAILLKPLLLVALAKIKLALLVGKPLALLALKKLLLKAVLGKLLLKIPLILFKGKALLVKMLALKFALITKGLVGLKAPLALLFLGACSLGSGLSLALSLGSKLKEHFGSEEDYSYEEEGYALPQPIYQYRPPPISSYRGSLSHSPSYGAPSDYSPAPAYSVPNPSYGKYFTSQTSGYGAKSYGGAGYPSVNSAVEQIVGFHGEGRRKRNTRSTIDGVEEDNEDVGDEEVEESEEDAIDETPENLRLEFEAARTNGNAYLYMASQFDEQSCGRRLICEVYQKPHESLSEDEILLQEIFGYPLAPLSEEDEGTPKEVYFKAAQLGSSYQSQSGSNVCARFYSTCRYDSQQLINIFVTEEVQTNEIVNNGQLAIHLQPPQHYVNNTSTRQPFYKPHQSAPVQLPRSPLRPNPNPPHMTVSKSFHQVQKPISAPVINSVRLRAVATPAV